MKAHAISLSTAILGLLFLTGCQPQSIDNSKVYRINDTANESRTITVQGAASVRATPDQAQVHMLIRRMGQDLNLLKAQVDQQTRQIQEVAVAFGLPPEQVITPQFSIYPEYRWVDEERVFKGYNVTRQVTLQLAQIEQVDQLVEQLVQAGVEQINSIQFQVTEQEALYNEALRRATSVAQHRAKLLAVHNQAQLGELIRLDEVSAGQPYPIEAMRMRAADASPTQPGEQEINAQVTATYRLTEAAAGD